MDKLNLLKARKQALLDAGKSIRDKISALVDQASFVEFDRYSFSKNQFYGEDVVGEGIVTGYATLNENQVYIVAQNAEVLNGGLSLAGARKICKCLDKAYVSGSPVIYFFSSLGVQAGEGIKVMEGVGEVLNKMQQLKEQVPQFAVCVGDVLGSNALFVASCDYTYMFKDSCVAYSSPLVISAKSGKMLDKNSVGGGKAVASTGLTVFEVESVEEIKESISNILNLLPDFGGIYLETADDPNRNAPSLNEKACPKCIIDAVFDKDYFVELGKGYEQEVVTGIGRIGGYSCASIIFGGDDGVKLNSKNISKVIDFIYYAVDNNLPLITFVNTCGIEENLEISNSVILRQVTDLVYALNLSNSIPKINVVYGKAIGLGYTLFASRALGSDYTYAFANAKISVFESEVGAQIEFGANGESLKKIKADYENNGQDAMNAAVDGFIDNVIEPEFVRQYVISALSMLI